MAEIKTVLTADATGLLTALDRIETSVRGIQDEYEKLQKSGGALFDSARASAASFSRVAGATAGALTQQQQQINQLARYYKFLENAQKQTTDPARIRSYSAELSRVRLVLEALEKTGVRAWDALEREAGQAGKAFEAAGKKAKAVKPPTAPTTPATPATPTAPGLGEQLSGLTNALGFASAGAGLALIAKEALSAAANYERLNASFTTFLGSAEKAETVLAQLTNFAGATPFSAEQVNEAGKALLAFGEDSENLIPVLTRIGDIAAATGKDFNELTIIYGKARTQGTLYAEDINQLTEAGIPIIEQFAKQMGIGADQVKKLASEGKIGFPQLELAFAELTSEGGRFQGLMEKQAQTLGGQYDQALSEVQKSLVDVGKAATPLAITLLNVFSDALVGIRQFVADVSTGASALAGDIKSVFFDLGSAIVSPFTLVQSVIDDTFETAKAGYKAFTDLFKSGEQLERERTAQAEQGNNDRERALKEYNDRVRDLQKKEYDDYRKLLAKNTGSTYEVEQKSNEELEKLRDAAAKDQQKRANDRAKQAAAAKKAQAEKDRQDRQREAEEDKRQQLAISLIDDPVEKEIALERVRYETLTQELNKYFEGRTELNGLLEQAEAQHLQNVTDIRKKADEEAFAELDKIIERLERENEIDAQVKEAQRERSEERLRAAFSQAQQEIELSAEVGKAKIIELRKSGAKEREVQKLEAQLDRQLQVQRLQAELEFQKALLAITDAGDEARIAEIENTIAIIQQRLQNAIDEADLQGREKVNLLSLLGIDPDDTGAVQALQESARRITDAFQAIARAKVEEAQATVEAANEKVSAAEAALEKELELQEQGFASDVDLRRRELEEAKKAQAEAVALQKKAQREQLVLESTVQAAGLITSSVNIFKSLTSALPAPIAVPLAIVTIATMLAAFAKVKSDAFKATKFRHGGEARITREGFVVGPSHDRGGVPIEVEGGEMLTSDGKRVNIVRREMTEKHFDILRAVNADDRDGILRYALELAGMKYMPFEPPRAVTDDATRPTGAHLQYIAPKGGRRVESLLEENNRILADLSKSGKRTVIDTDDRRIEITGNKTRIIRKQHG